MSLCTITDIREHLLAAFDPEWLAVIDDSAAHAGHLESPVQHGDEPSGATHIRIRIVKAEWAGLSRVQRHRLVYDALSECLARGLHAVAIEWLASPPAA